MTIDPLLLHNLLLAARAIAGGLLYMAATLCLGVLLLDRLRAVGGHFAIVLASVAGMALYSALFTSLALSGVAHPAVVLVAVGLPFIGAWRQIPRVWHGVRQTASRLVTTAARHWTWGAVILLFVGYAGLIIVSNPIGGDLGNYHLIVPRDVLWNRGFAFNAFSHEAGIPYGWHLYGVPAFLLGGDRGYIVLSFVAFALLLALVWLVARAWRDESFAVAAVAATAFIICGLVRGNIANNDVPSVLIEAVALLLAVHRLPIPASSQAALFGLVAGFGLAVKLQLATSVLVLVLLFSVRIARMNWRVAATAGAIGVPFAILWPAVTFANTGSPLPQVMMALRTQGPPLPHMRDAMAALDEGFGDWYVLNLSKLFAHGMEGFTLLVAAVPFAIWKRGTVPADAVARLLVAYGVGRWLLLSAATQRLDILMHDRYHLMSFLALALSGLCGWHRLVAPFAAGRRRPIAAALGTLVVWAVAGWQFTARYEMRTPHALSPDGVRYEVRGSLLDDMRTKLRSFRQRPGAGSEGGLYDWMAEELPRDAVVATTVIDPYHIQRRAIQLLPVSQDRIDLSLPPEAILAELQKLGVTHLHLTQFSGLNAWMNPVNDQWLTHVREIPTLQGVEPLKRISAPSDKGEQAVYRIDWRVAGRRICSAPHGHGGPKL